MGIASLREQVMQQMASFTTTRHYLPARLLSESLAL